MRVVVIEPRSSGLDLVTHASRLGYEAVVLTANRPGRTVASVVLDGASEVHVVDTNDEQATLELLGTLHAQETIDAVLPGFEHYVQVAAAAAQHLGLAGLTPLAATRLRHKHLMRKAVHAAGLAQPGHREVGSLKQVEDAVAAVGLPCVVKPVDQSGSRGVRKAHTVQEARDAVCRVLADADPFLDRPGLGLALIEEYVDGREVSIEGFVHGGIVSIAGVTDKRLGRPPFFVEQGHDFPARMPSSDRADLHVYTEAVIRALGLTTGPFHAEVRLSTRGPLLMEVAARLPGDRIPDLVRLAGGADLVSATVACGLGRPPGPVPVPGRHAGIRYVMGEARRHHDGYVVDPLLVSRLREHGELVEAGAPIPAPGSSDNRVAYALAVGDDAADLDALLDAVTAPGCLTGPDEVPPTLPVHVLVLNRWGTRFAEYHRYIDHDRHRVSYVTTPGGARPLDRAAAEEVITLPDLADSDAVLHAARDLAQRHGSFDAVIALSEFDLDTAAAIRADLAIPGMGPDAVAFVRDKVVMKRAVAAAGLRVPAHVVPDSGEDVREFAATVGPSLVLKPRSGADSQGVHVVHSADELDDVLGTLDLTGYECEEYIDGTLMQIDGVVRAGQVQAMRSWNCIGTCLGFATGTPFASVSNDDEQLERRVREFTQGVVQALGLQDEVIHLEVFREKGTGELVFLEIAARPGGGQVRLVWDEVYGIDLIEAAIHAQLGRVRTYPAVTPSTSPVAGYLMMPQPAQLPAVVHEVSSLLGRVEGLYAETLPEAGTVLDGHGGAVDTAGTFRFRGASAGQVEAMIERSITLFDIRTSTLQVDHV